MERPVPMEVDSKPENKQAYAAQLVHRFFAQLTRGCGRPNCPNIFCASNPSTPRLTPNDAAKQAVQLVARPDATNFLCPPVAAVAPTPMAVSEPNQPVAALPQPERMNYEPARTTLPVTIGGSGVSPMSGTSPVSQSRSASSPISGSLLDRKPEPPVVIDVDDIQELVASAMSTNDYTPLIRRVGSIFSKHENLTGPASMQSPGLDFSGIKECFDLLLNLPNLGSQKSLVNALEIMGRGLKVAAQSFTTPEQLRAMLFMLEFPSLWDQPDYQKTLLVPLCSAIGALPKSLQNYLNSWWQRIPDDEFRSFVQRIQDFIAIRITTSSVQSLNRDEAVTSATKVLSILSAIPQHVGRLLLEIDMANEARHLLPFTDFYNEMVNEHYDESEDFSNWKRGGGFSFCNYPFILDAGTKGAVLTFESRVQQEHERQQAFRRTLQSGHPEIPVLIFKIRRQHLLSDSVRELSHKAPEDLRKELRVSFIGEEALDEGGVQKEWFQLVIRLIFDPNYGMFTLDPGTHNYWFSTTSQDFAELTLIGKMLGLAIYNGVILDVHFPPVVFKKMMGIKPEFSDLKTFNPGLYDGLQKLLNYPGDVEADIGETFQVPYESFGETKYHPLKPDGANIAVTNQNRQEYVDLYLKWLLEDSVAPQFGAFLNGFKMVCDSPAFGFFRPEELELCVCGLPELDFEALEKGTHYESFTANDQVVRWFWEIVHAMPLELKKKLLFFATGSDRAPPGGLGKLRFIIQRAGGDSDRLPESHTCFNHLMLPEYASKKKLEDLLGKALNHAEGFGMR